MSFAFLGRVEGRPCLYSQLAGVVPGYQDRGIGRRLKLAELEFARAEGLALIARSFDPLRARNAHFNLVVLGASARGYVEDMYGPRTDVLNRSMPTDRLIAAWETAPRPRPGVPGEQGRGLPRAIEARVRADVVPSVLAVATPCGGAAGAPRDPGGDPPMERSRAGAGRAVARGGEAILLRRLHRRISGRQLPPGRGARGPALLLPPEPRRMRRRRGGCRRAEAPRSIAASARSMKLSVLTSGIEHRLLGADRLDLEVTAVLQHAHLVRPGALFAAIPGAGDDDRGGVPRPLRAAPPRVSWPGETSHSCRPGRHRRMDGLACLNGELMPSAAARVPVWDRGFLCGDAVDEVSRVYDGRCWLEPEHLARLRRSLAEVQIGGVDLDGPAGRIRRTIAASGLREAMAYVQVTRGVAPRDHPFPDPPVPPTEVILVWAYDDEPAARMRAAGVAAISHPDLRWGRCDVESTNLLANVLANEAARRAGCFEAVLVDAEGRVAEATHSSVLWVRGGRIEATPEGRPILPGTTRQGLLRLVSDAGLDFTAASISLDELRRTEEVLLLGTTIEVLPVARLDDAPIADGRPGPVARELQAAARQAVARRLAGSA